MEKKPSQLEDHCTVEHIAAILRNGREEILDEWRARTGELLRSLKLDRATLTDHIPVIVDQIIDDLSSRRENDAHAGEMHTKTPHGAQRFVDGLDIGQVVAEFALLRAAFFSVMDRHCNYIVGEAVRIINRRIDYTLREAVLAFADKQARNLKAQDDDHFAFVVHDLRTPLSVLVLLTCVLEKERAEEVSSVETFELMKRNCERMNQNIKRMMKERAERITPSGIFQPQCRSFELWPMVQELCVDLRAAAKNEGIKVVNKIPYLMTVWGDAGLVSQVIQNLLGNAFKHAPNGQVVISAKVEEDCVVCSVVDDGAGIPAEILPTIFEMHATTSGQSGSGLGLAIVKQIVEGHGGKVSVENSPGAGCAFSFTLPVQSEQTGNESGHLNG